MTAPHPVTQAQRATLRRRRAAAMAQREALRERAWLAARACADVLRGRYGASRVVVFGSLVEEGGRRFGLRSDIDLAAWGIQAGDYFAAVAEMQRIAREFEVDLVAMERCPAHLQAPIAEHGEAL